MINKQFSRKSALIRLCSLAALIAITPVDAASAVPELTPSAQIESSELEPGLPGRRLGGGSRRDTVFANVSESLVALTTPSNLSITTAAQPVFLFYIPEMVSANKGELILRDSSDELVYEATFSIDAEGGIFSTQMAQEVAQKASYVPDMPVLRPNENYQWYFSIYAEGADRASDVAVNGSVCRVNKADWLAKRAIEAEQLATADPLTKAKLLYQEANLWHDAAVIIHELRQAEPNNDAIASEWTQLLASVGIDRLIQPTSASVQAGLN